MSQDRYQVVAPYVLLTVDTTDGWRKQGYGEGTIVPDSVPQQEIDDHVNCGLVVKLDSPPAPSPDPPLEQEVTGEASGESGSIRKDSAGVDTVELPAEPKRDDPKGAWEDYAVALTAGTPEPLTKEQASALTKAELLERFRG
jgi:hypothetical protein